MESVLTKEVVFASMASFLAPVRMIAFERISRKAMTMTDTTQTWSCQMMQHASDAIKQCIHSFRDHGTLTDKAAQGAFCMFAISLDSMLAMAGCKGVLKYCLGLVRFSEKTSCFLVDMTTDCQPQADAWNLIMGAGNRHQLMELMSEGIFDKKETPIKKCAVSIVLALADAKQSDVEMLGRIAGTPFEVTGVRNAEQETRSDDRTHDSSGDIPDDRSNDRLDDRSDDTSAASESGSQARSIPGCDIDEGKEDALAATAMEADELDNAALMQVLNAAKADASANGIPLNADGVALMRLTRMARSPGLRAHLRKTPLLEPCRHTVAEAACSLEPLWGEGALLLIPLSHEQLTEAGITLSYDNVVLLSHDVDKFKAALKEFNCKGKKRPTLTAIGDDAIHNKRQRGETGQSSDSGGPWVRTEESSTLTTCSEASVANDDFEDAPVEVEMVTSFSLRTDSSLGLPQNPYRS